MANVNGKKRLCNGQIQFIKNQFKLKGTKLCAQILNRSEKTILSWANKLDLKMDPILRQTIRADNWNKQKQSRGYNVDWQLFDKIETKQVAYILGYMWADGYLAERGYCINLQILSSDADCIQNIMDKTGKWGRTNRTRVNRKPQSKFCTGQKPLYNVFVKYGFLNREGSHEQVLQYIPKQLHRFFWLGYLDGDGCIYTNKKALTVSFCSSYNQDWQALSKFLNQNNISHSITKRIQKTKDGKINKHSVVKCRKKGQIKNLIQILYTDKNIGLVRKYNKYINSIKFDKQASR